MLAMLFYLSAVIQEITFDSGGLSNGEQICLLKYLSAGCHRWALLTNAHSRCKHTEKALLHVGLSMYTQIIDKA